MIMGFGWVCIVYISKGEVSHLKPYETWFKVIS